MMSNSPMVLFIGETGRVSKKKYQNISDLLNELRDASDTGIRLISIHTIKACGYGEYMLHQIVYGFDTNTKEKEMLVKTPAVDVGLFEQRIKMCFK